MVALKMYIIKNPNPNHYKKKRVYKGKYTVSGSGSFKCLFLYSVFLDSMS